MTQRTDVEPPWDLETDTKAVLARWRHHIGAIVLGLLILAVIAGAWILYDRPSHTYQVEGNATTWIADVNVAITRSGGKSPIAASGALHHLPGVCTIKSVIVESTSAGRKVMVMFLKSRGWNETGLIYLKGFPPPSDTCNVHLSGPWWQVGALDVTSMGCPRGYHFTPGG